MGKVKQLFQEMWEEKLLAEEKHYASGSSVGSVGSSAFPQDSQEWAQHEKDFNAWLDAYEKSFGKQGGEL